MEVTEKNIENFDFAEIVKELEENYIKLKRTEEMLRSQLEPLNTAISKIADCTRIFPDQIEIYIDRYHPKKYLSFVKDKDNIYMLVTMEGDRPIILREESQIYLEESLSKLPQFIKAYKKKLEKRNEEIKLDYERLEMYIGKVKDIVEDMSLKDKVENADENAKEKAKEMAYFIEESIDKDRLTKDKLEIFIKEINARLKELSL